MPYVPPVTNAINFTLTSFAVKVLRGANFVLTTKSVVPLTELDFELVSHTLPLFSDVSFNLAGEATEYSLLAAKADFTCLGASSILTRSLLQSLNSGVLWVSGNNSYLAKTSSLFMEDGSVAVSGVPIVGLKDATLVAASTSYGVNGEPVSTFKDAVLATFGGETNIVGSGTTLSRILVFLLDCMGGAIGEVGCDTTLISDKLLPANNYSMALHGEGVSLLRGYSVVVDSGGVLLVPQSGTGIAYRVLDTEPGSDVCLGNTADLLKAFALLCKDDNTAIEGELASLRKSLMVCPMDAGNIQVVSGESDLALSRLLALAASELTLEGIAALLERLRFFPTALYEGNSNISMVIEQRSTL